MAVSFPIDPQEHPLLGSLKPLEGEEANAARRQLAELKQQLETLNAEVKRLGKERKFGESNIVADKARSLVKPIKDLAKSVDPFELAIANSLWVDKTYPLSRTYQQTIEKFYGSSQANSCDFQNHADAERGRINDWVSDNTREKIQNIIPAGALSRETRLVIANAIYFKGNWSQPFQSSLTTPAQFTSSQGTQSTVSMMSAPMLDVASYAAFADDGSVFETPSMVTQDFNETQGYPSGDGYQVLELPYVGDRLSMLCVLPRQANNLNKLVASFTAEKFEACRTALKKRPVHVKLPRFKTETTYNLIPDLRTLGMQDAFSPERADFTGLTEGQTLAERLYISLVIHKAFVEVNEQGTEAAAATVVGMARASAPVQRPFIPEFTANRPFLAAIVDKVSGMILFVGKIETP
ncbi:MAG: serpin family protein [Pirellulaceae bacterium]|nr:serpin family protein [Pirellulaceae bacterium]